MSETQQRMIDNIAQCIERHLFFTVVFQPRSGRPERRMHCNCAAVSSVGQGLINVRESGKAGGWRSFGIEAVRELRACGEVVRI